METVVQGLSIWRELRKPIRGLLWVISRKSVRSRMPPFGYSHTLPDEILKICTILLIFAKCYWLERHPPYAISHGRKYAGALIRQHRTPGMMAQITTSVPRAPLVLIQEGNYCALWRLCETASV